MSLYRHNSNKAFILTVLFLFLVVLLMIPLRPSVWDREEALAEISDSLQQIGLDSLVSRDSLVFKKVISQDTQFTFAPNIDSTAIDTTIEIKTVESIDTTILTLATPPPSPPRIEKAETTGPSLLSLLWWLFLFIVLAWIIYKWLTTRWQKQYWLEYNAKLQPLATLSNSNSNINFDFSELPLKTTALKTNDPLPEKELVNKTIEEPTIVEPELPKEEEPEADSEPISDEQTNDPANLPKAQTKQVDQITIAQKPKTAFSERWYVLLLMEVFGRLPRILFEMGRGMASIFSFFSTGNQKRKPLDLKWQDGVSVIMILFFIACKTVIFPSEPTSIAGNIFLGLFVWASPALLRLHWAWGVLGIFIIFGEIIGLVIYVILQALKDAAPSDGDSTNLLIGLAVLGSLFFLYWAKKKNLLPTFKSLISFVLIAVGAYFIFLPYINYWMLGDPLFDDWGGLVTRFIILYILYLVVTAIVNPAAETAPNKKSTNKVIDSTPSLSKNTDLEITEVSESENVSKTLSSEELMELFKTKNWYKKSALDQFDMVSMHSMQLDEQSEFIVLYLPDCINLRRLYLSNNNFLEVPYEISELEQLEILHLSYNNINTIFPEIEYLKNLKVLFLADNNISEIPPELANLSQLTQIDLTGNPLTKEAIHQLESYFPNASLKFDPPKEENIPVEKKIVKTPIVELTEDESLVKKVRKHLHKELKNPEQVYALSTLMNKKLPDLPLSVFQEFSNLKSLFLNSNSFTEIPAAIYHLPALTTLGLSYNKITSLPDKINSLQNLKELDLSGNPIHSFSPAIIQNKNLRKISLGNLGLTIFPAFLLKMQQLESINLTGNHILRIPQNIQELSNLKELNLSFSGINTIPDEIFTLTNLRALEWTGNNLEKIPPKITALENLEKLAIGFNSNLESPTAVLKALPKLKELYISGLKGGIKTPMISNIGVLQTLQTLWLSYNELQDLPDSLFDLKQVKRLSLANNKLDRLPERLGELSNLEYLYLEKNQLTTLPNSIKKLKKLRRLNLSNNPIDIKEKRALQRVLPNVRIQY